MPDERTGFSITLRSPADQEAFKRLQTLLTAVLGLNWKSSYGMPDGEEIAADCAEALWDAGVRVPRAKGEHTPGASRRGGPHDHCVECSAAAREWVEWPCSRDRLVKAAIDQDRYLRSMDDQPTIPPAMPTPDGAA